MKSKYLRKIQKNMAGAGISGWGLGGKGGINIHRGSVLHFLKPKRCTRVYIILSHHCCWSCLSR